jgi:hypothetical protein
MDPIAFPAACQENAVDQSMWSCEEQNRLTLIARFFINNLAETNDRHETSKMNHAHHAPQGDQLPWRATEPQHSSNTARKEQGHNKEWAMRIVADKSNMLDCELIIRYDGLSENDLREGGR